MSSTGHQNYLDKSLRWCFFFPILIYFLWKITSTSIFSNAFIMEDGKTPLPKINICILISLIVFNMYFQAYNFLHLAFFTLFFCEKTLLWINFLLPACIFYSWKEKKHINFYDKCSLCLLDFQNFWEWAFISRNSLLDGIIVIWSSKKNKKVNDKLA